MDAVEFFSEFRRMCKSSSDCTKCQYHGDKCDNAIELLKKTVAEIEQWPREHPRKTRQSEFLKMFPNAPLYSGVVWVDPCKVDRTFECQHCGGCSSECRRNYWLQEVE